MFGVYIFCLDSSSHPPSWFISKKALIGRHLCKEEWPSVTQAVLRHKLWRMSVQLGPDFLHINMPFTSQNSRRFSVQTLVLETSTSRSLTRSESCRGSPAAGRRNYGESPEALTQTFALHAAPQENVRRLSGVQCMSERSFAVQRD